LLEAKELFGACWRTQKTWGFYRLQEVKVMAQTGSMKSERQRGGIYSSGDLGDARKIPETKIAQRSWSNWVKKKERLNGEI
jgi:hypothetical protein